ncbi:MAG TPA: 30S ribosomal protein S17 [Candidatus Vogelbacteria bacterium]|nr:30S ribosomal protein S17 [Candidatus Vogelbacteria bacterium]
MKIENKNKKQLKGVVVSDKMEKTAVVSVIHLVKHPKYGKFIKKIKRYKAENPENRFKIGQKVIIRETRPLSKDKSFIIVSLS